LPRPKRARIVSNPALTIQQKQMSNKRIIPAITPMTIPAIAPPLSPLLVLDEVIGIDVPLAETAERKVCVVVAETTAVAVETPPLLVPLTGGEYVVGI
jgi:hypothetical protein